MACWRERQSVIHTHRHTMTEDGGEYTFTAQRHTPKKLLFLRRCADDGRQMEVASLGRAKRLAHRIHWAQRERGETSPSEITCCTRNEVEQLAFV
jgi:hypothetical protein